MEASDMEKEFWRDLSEGLNCIICLVFFGPNGEMLVDSNKLLEYCNDVRESMMSIIYCRRKYGVRAHYLIKRRSVGLKGMENVLFGKYKKCRSRVDFFSEKVNLSNFSSFCECLEAISGLSRGGGFAWLGNKSALSKSIQRHCSEAAKKLRSFWD